MVDVKKQKEGEIEGWRSKRVRSKAGGVRSVGRQETESG